MTKEQEHLIEHIDALKRDKHIIESLVTTAADIGQRVRNLVPRTGTPMDTISEAVIDLANAIKDCEGQFCNLLDSVMARQTERLLRTDPRSDDLHDILSRACFAAGMPADCDMRDLPGWLRAKLAEDSTVSGGEHGHSYSANKDPGDSPAGAKIEGDQ